MKDKLKSLLELPRRKPNQMMLLLATVALLLTTGFSMYFSDLNHNDSGGNIAELLEKRRVVLNIDGVETEKVTDKQTVGEMLQAEGLILRPYDEIEPARATEIQNDMTISVQIARTLTIEDGGVEKKVITTPRLVGAVLRENRIAIQEDDRVEPSLTTVIDANSKISIVRVEKTEETEVVPVAFETVKKKDGNMVAGKTKVVQRGKKGKAQNTYAITKENGKVISKTLIAEKEITEPVDKVVKVGTKNSEFQPLVKGKTYKVKATAYTVRPKGGSNLTATGFNLAKNMDAKVIAVDPRVIPLGSKVYVEGYGYARAIDVGGAIKGHKIDIFLNSHDKAIRWGVRTVEIRVVA